MLCKRDAPTARKSPIIKKYEHSVKKQTGIVIAGSAGQKIKSSATLFAEAGILSGLDATQKDDYPITVMTGHSIAEIIISPEKIDYTAIESPDYFIVISKDGLKRTWSRIEKLSDSCTLLVEETLELPETQAKIIRLPLLQKAKKLYKLTMAVMSLAAMLKHSNLYPLDALKRTISNFQKPSVVEINLEAVNMGSELLKN